MYKALLFLVLYLPFQLALNPVAGVDLASIRILILGLFGAWLAQGLKNRQVKLNSSGQAFLVLAFLGLNFLSISVATNADWSVRKLLFLFSIFPIYFVASQLINSKQRFLEVVSGIVWSGTLAAFVGVVQFGAQFIYGVKAVFVFWSKFVIVPFLGNSFGEAVLKNPSWLVNISGQTYLRATSFFPDPHMFSFYLGLVLPLAVGIIFYKQRRSWYIGAASIIFLADILTFSRGGYVGLLAGIIFTAIFFWHKVPKKYKISMGFVLGIGCVILLFPSPISQRFLSSLDLKEGSNQGRLVMWKAAGEIILVHPILGVGIGNYPLAVTSLATYRDPIYAHNTYLDIAVETGLPNMFIWVGLLGVSMFSFWKKTKQETLFFFALISLLIFASHSLTETAIYSPVVLTLFLVILSFSQLKLNNEKTT
jgi:O-antigen ligase